MLLGNSKLQLPPQIFYRIAILSVVGPLYDLNVLLLPLLCCLGIIIMFRVIVMLEDSSSMFWLKEVFVTVRGHVAQLFLVTAMPTAFRSLTGSAGVLLG